MNEFLRSEEFDFLSLRSFRREAVIQYVNTNQSEPLRILLCFLLAIGGAILPFFLPSVGSPIVVGPAVFVASALVCAVGTALFLRERGKRTEQLARLESEYALGDLRVELSDPATGLDRRERLRELRTKQRVVLLFGSELQLQEGLSAAAPYRRRFVQSQTILVPVSLGGDQDDAQRACEAALGSRSEVRNGRKWLASAVSPGSWCAYLDKLLQDRELEDSRSVWVALNYRGRVLGSNFGCPIWDELFAALPPTNGLLSTEPGQADASGAAAEVLAAQAEFYRALLSGDAVAMQRLFLPVDDPELSFNMQVGENGRDTNLSAWDVVLAERNRPELVIAGQDVTVRNGGSATTTCIEHPVLGPTLLATQVWELSTPTASSGGSDRAVPLWKLKSHRTIPYAPKVEARVALRCDHRGCICFGKQFNAMR